MKIRLKPLKGHRADSPLKVVVETGPPEAKAVAYQQLVTGQNVAPERATALLQSSGK